MVSCTSFQAPSTSTGTNQARRLPKYQPVTDSFLGSQWVVTGQSLLQLRQRFPFLVAAELLDADNSLWPLSALPLHAGNHSLYLKTTQSNWLFIGRVKCNADHHQPPGQIGSCIRQVIVAQQNLCFALWVFVSTICCIKPIPWLLKPFGISTLVHCEPKLETISNILYNWIFNYCNAMLTRISVRFSFRVHLKNSFQAAYVNFCSGRAHISGILIACASIELQICPFSPSSL